MITFRRALVAAVLFALLPSQAEASIRVLPMSYDLTPAGTGATKDIRVENTGAEPMPVEVFVHRREILEDGSERRTVADDDFLVFPPQALIPANGFQTFRVQYIGDPTIVQTALYLVTVSQLPVDAANGRANNVQFLFNLGTLAAVSPPDSRPDLRVVEVKPAPEPGHLEISVRNEGNRNARLRNGTWTVRSGDGSATTVDDRDVRRAIKQGLIEPGTERVVTLPVPAGFQLKGAEATFALRNTDAE
jgi:fimbrial chaperone protein